MKSHVAHVNELTVVACRDCRLAIGKDLDACGPGAEQTKHCSAAPTHTVTIAARTKTEREEGKFDAQELRDVHTRVREENHLPVGGCCGSLHMRLFVK